jgi:hypothetical protein
MTVEELLKLASDDTGLAIERVSAIPDAVAGVSLYADAVNEAYWKRKDLPLTVLLARCGIQHGLTSAAALPQTEAERRGALRSKAKAIAYNLASFTWPGWDEQGIVCDASSIAIGYDAAKLNVRLAKELNKGDLPLSRGLWMLAGHELCRKKFAVARGHYLEGTRHAHAAGSAPDEALGKAFAALVDVVESPLNAERHEALARLTKKLGEVEDGAAFVQQVETAGRVFLKK